MCTIIHSSWKPLQILTYKQSCGKWQNTFRENSIFLKPKIREKTFESFLEIQSIMIITVYFDERAAQHFSPIKNKITIFFLIQYCWDHTSKLNPIWEITAIGGTIRQIFIPKYFFQLIVIADSVFLSFSNSYLVNYFLYLNLQHTIVK